MVTPFPPSAEEVSAPEPLEAVEVTTGSVGATHSTRRRREGARAADADGHSFPSFPPGATSMATRNPVYTAFISGQKLCL